MIVTEGYDGRWDLRGIVSDCWWQHWIARHDHFKLGRSEAKIARMQ